MENQDQIKECARAQCKSQCFGRKYCSNPCSQKDIVHFHKERVEAIKLTHERKNWKIETCHDGVERKIKCCSITTCQRALDSAQEFYCAEHIKKGRQDFNRRGQFQNWIPKISEASPPSGNIFLSFLLLDLNILL